MLPQLCHPESGPAVVVMSPFDHPLSGRVHAGHNGIGGTGGAKDRGQLPHPVRVHPIGKEQGSLSQGGKGLVGRHYNSIRFPEGSQT